MNTDPVEAAIELFLAVRPYYVPEHVRDLAEQFARQRVPFCRSCADWHFPDEEHSSDD